MKKLFRLGFAAILAMAILVLAGCSNSSGGSSMPPESHTHTYATEWSSDETHHWQAATCGHTDAITKNPHKWSDWETVTAATKDATGTKKKTCSTCKKEITDVIPKIPEDHEHSYSDWQTSDDKHWKSCECGAEQDKGDHTWQVTKTISATCSKRGVKISECSVCKKQKNESISPKEHTWNAGEVTTAATCITEGTKTFTCTACDTTKTESISKVDHTWNVTSDTGTTRKAGTKTSICTVCSETKTENSAKKTVPASAVSLATLGAKSIIADSELGTYGISTTSLPAKINGATYYKFGVYPQTIKGSSVTVDETIINLEFDEVDYYLGSDNNWYAKCIENGPITGDAKYSDGTKVAQISANSTKYFKVEPIVWRKLNGSGYLLAEKVLTSTSYYPYSATRTINGKTVYESNYEHSRIRAFLNGYKYASKESDSAAQIDNADFYNKGLLQTAFTKNQRSQIKTTTVDNSSDSTTDSENKITKSVNYVCSNTQDKIFILSELEATTTGNSFEANATTEDNAKIKMPTDYAKANMAYQSSTTGQGGFWRLRSPVHNVGSYVRYVNVSGKSSVSATVNFVSYGIAPALALTEW